MEIQEEETPLLTFDASGLYINGENRQLRLQREGSFDSKLFDAYVITLEAHASSSLNWDEALLLAKSQEEKGAYLVWEFDFGWGIEPEALEEKAPIATYALTLAHFAKVVYPQFTKSSLGAILGKWIVEKSFIMDDKSFKEWAEDLSYLASHLPYTITPILYFDLSIISSLSLLYTKFFGGLFEHILLGLKDAFFPLPALCWKKGVAFLGSDEAPLPMQRDRAVGLCIPEKSCDYERIDRLIAQLQAKGITPRLIAEHYLCEQWNELDYLIVMQEELTEKSERKYFGFQITGGELVYFEEIEKGQFGSLESCSG